MSKNHATEIKIENQNRKYFAIYIVNTFYYLQYTSYASYRERLPTKPLY